MHNFDNDVLGLAKFQVDEEMLSILNQLIGTYSSLVLKQSIKRKLTNLNTV